MILDGNTLTDFQDERLESQLKILGLNDNTIGNFSDNNYPLLEELGLSVNPLANFTNNDLPNLQYLSLQGCLLTEFSLSNKLPKLEELLLYSNQITEFRNKELEQKLRTLSLGSNQITNFSNRNFESLEMLSLNRNPLESFEDNQFPQATEMSLASCGLVGKLSPTISIPKIVSLDLNQNHLTSFDCIGVNTLSYLNLSSG